MTATELKRKFPLTWKEFENGWHPLEYPMNDEIDIYQLRFYFDSVGLISNIDYYTNINTRFKSYYTTVEGWSALLPRIAVGLFERRKTAETACILKCFEIREKQLKELL